jgi:hypothetical protein
MADADGWWLVAVGNKRGWASIAVHHGATELTEASGEQHHQIVLFCCCFLREKLRVLRGFAMRMPEGALSFKMIEALRQSIHSAPEWQSRMNQAANERNRIAVESNRQMAETNRREAAKRSEIIAQTGREIADIQMGTWQSRNESMDRQQRETIEGIHGVETYNDPHYGGTVQLSNQYQQAWQLRDGSYVLTDDVNFEPGRDLGVTGQKLMKTE